MIEFFGHFHPLIVHLPIGILLIGLWLQWLSRKPKYVGIKPAVAITLLIGSISALIACVTGYLLSITDDYDQSLINWHMWFAIAVFVTSAILYTKEVNPKVEINTNLLAGALLLMVMVTGHLGGSLTHGSDYLSKPLLGVFNNDSTPNTAIKPLPNVQEAIAYYDVIRPIIETKCVSCHNANKRKGGLRMDEIALLMKGGKNGKVIDLENIDSSEMIQRMLLPPDNDDHMPPKEKPQPTESQVALLRWWISNRADATKKVKELPQPGNIKTLLFALQQPAANTTVASIIPAKPVAKADEKALAELKAAGISVMPVASTSNYLTVSIIAKKSISKNDLDNLAKLKDQLIWLKISDANLTDEAAPILMKLTNVNRLNLSGTTLTDKCWQAFGSMKLLEHLNIVGTNAALPQLKQLSHLSKLRNIYLYKSLMQNSDYATLKSLFPKAEVDTGNYHVPLLTTDTTIVTRKL